MSDIVWKSFKVGTEGDISPKRQIIQAARRWAIWS
jgi:hypothetical protein